MLEDPDGDLRFQESPSGDRLKSTLPTQRSLSQELEDANLREALGNTANDTDKKKMARLRSVSAKYAGFWLDVVPSRALGLALSGGRVHDPGTLLVRDASILK